MFIPHQNTFDAQSPVVLRTAFAARSSLPVKSGLVAGSLVETDTGWCPVENLRVGQRVGTYDGGLQPVRRVGRAAMRPRALATPSEGLLHVPGGALGNCAPIDLLDEQLILIDSAEAERLLGDPSTLVPAAALEGYRGIERVWPEAEIEVISLGFDDEEIVYANTGVLFHCTGPKGENSGFFTQLDKGRARALLGVIERDPEPFAGALAPAARQSVLAA